MSKPKKDKGWTSAENPEMHRAMVGKRTSGAAGVHGDKRDKRARTRGAKKRRALGDQ